MDGSPLRQVLVVETDIALQGGHQVLGAVEVMRREHLGKPAVEALDHAAARDG